VKGRTTRTICILPTSRRFSCQKSDQPAAMIPWDQLEAIRLVDVEGKSQVETAAIMGISRGTVQRLCYKARKAITSSLLSGSDIVVCEGHGVVVRQNCRKQCICQLRKEREIDE
jgi:predicted DNA-binding protein (UPF0251 family)